MIFIQAWFKWLILLLILLVPKVFSIKQRINYLTYVCAEQKVEMGHIFVNTLAGLNTIELTNPEK